MTSGTSVRSWGSQPGDRGVEVVRLDVRPARFRITERLDHQPLVGVIGTAVPVEANVARLGPRVLIGRAYAAARRILPAYLYRHR